jgi:putative transposase
MPAHVPLIVRPRAADYDIAENRTAIKAPVGRKVIAYLESEAPDWIPKITRNRGKKTERLFWQSGGGYDRNVVKPETLMKMIDYIHLNPIRRGLVERPEDWKWSSAAWYAGARDGGVVPDSIPPEWVVGLP